MENIPLYRIRAISLNCRVVEERLKPAPSPIMNLPIRRLMKLVARYTTIHPRRMQVWPTRIVLLGPRSSAMKPLTNKEIMIEMCIMLTEMDFKNRNGLDHWDPLPFANFRTYPTRTFPLDSMESPVVDLLDECHCDLCMLLQLLLKIPKLHQFQLSLIRLLVLLQP